MSSDPTSMPPDLAAAEAALHYHASQLAVIRGRIDDVRRGEDSEPLHKFRVAVRRTRSALDQLHRIFPADAVERFSAEFRWVQNATGAARDADVYVQRMRDYERALPRALVAALEPIRAELHRRRAAAYDAVRELLDDPRFLALLDEWQAFLASIDADSYGEDGALPIRVVAGGRLWRAWKRVRKRGKGVDEHTPVREVHRLRIACKKLRYLLEMFRPLYGDAELRPLIRPLKRLQDDLGDFHDLDVQQQALEAMAAATAADGSDLPGTGAACAALRAELRRRQRRELASFAGEFEALTSAAPKERARRLFREPAEEVQPR